MKHLNIFTGALFFIGLGFMCCNNDSVGSADPENGAPSRPVDSDVELYVTTGHKSMLFKQLPLDYCENDPMSPYEIRIDPDTRYQEIVGFGPAITGSTGYNLQKMTAEDREKILRECFDTEEGLGFSLVRISIGGSDFTLGEYTWCDQEGIDFFDVHLYDRRDVFPVLKEILEINPDVKIIGTPWSCPRWMKVGLDGSSAYNGWTSGRLNPACYEDYAEYFVMWIETMETEGFPIYAITVQNEPLNKGNSMSLYMPWEDQAAFIKVLGPKMQARGLKTKILCYDHNYNYDNVAGQENYVVKLFGDQEAAQWIAGSAWHNYGGNVSELDNIRTLFPQKEIYFTEASIGSWGYNFSNNTLGEFESIFLGTMSRGGRGVTLWNLMLDENGAPNRPGGCQTCFGVVDISSKNYAYESIERNSQYYDLAHCSKVIKQGAVRIATNDTEITDVKYMAFENPDGSYAFVAVNRGSDSRKLTINDGIRHFSYDLPGNAIASFRWGKTE